MRLAVLLLTHFAGFALTLFALMALQGGDLAAGAVLAFWGVALMALTTAAPTT